MKYPYIILAIIALMFTGCTSEQKKKHEPMRDLAKVDSSRPLTIDSIAQMTFPIDSNSDDSAAEPVDSFKIITNQYLTAKIELPPVYQREIFEANSEATDKFSKLSKACHGRMKILVSAGEVVKEIKETIKAVSTNESDLLILLDRTGSMHNDIFYVKQGINEIIDTITRYKNTRLAIAIYGDKNWDWKGTWFKFRNFETNYDAAARYVDSIQVVGNLDWPESVYDAIVSSLDNPFWRSTKKRNIILVGDAPPQEKPLSDFSLDEVISKAKSMKVVANFYPILIMPEIHKVILSPEDKDKYKEIKNNTTLYPNPCTGTLNLSMEQTATYYLEMYNVNGEAVLDEEFYGIHWTKDITNLPNGVYV